MNYMDSTTSIFFCSKVILLILLANVGYSQSKNWEAYAPLIKTYASHNYKGMFRDAEGALKHPFIVPGSAQYPNQLWDWDSWWTNIALRQIIHESGSKQRKNELLEYEKGSILNFLDYGGADGFIPYMITPKSGSREETIQYFRKINGGLFEGNMHKPVLAQHAAFIVKQNNGDATWLREKFFLLQSFVDAYYHHYRHRLTGLYFFANDKGTGTDNDPTHYYRPGKSTSTPFLNALVYKELLAMIYLCEQLNLEEIATHYKSWADDLKESVQKHSWDPLMDYFFSVDLNLLPAKDPNNENHHIGMPRHYDALIMRIMTWTGFCALWAEMATDKQAKAIVEKHFRDTTNLKSKYGIRTLSPLEKMYYVGASGNPSSWLGPIWIVSNYMTFKGLINYGYNEEAKEIAIATVMLLGSDIERHGSMHEYYLPSNGEPVLNPGFLNWNLLVINMIAWLEDREVIYEF